MAHRAADGPNQPAGGAGGKAGTETGGKVLVEHDDRHAPQGAGDAAATLGGQGADALVEHDHAAAQQFRQPDDAQVVREVAGAGPVLQQARLWVT